MNNGDDVTTLTDSLLLERIQKGDTDSFETLFYRHYDRVYGLLYRLVGNRAEAEDLAQEVFIKLTRKLKTFKQKSSFKTWLFRIAVNAAKDYCKKNSTRKQYESAYEKEYARDNPGFLKEETAETEKLLLLIDQLPDKQKASIMLVMGEGLSHGEAAKVLKCSEKTISWRIHQARSKLKAAFPGGF